MVVAWSNCSRNEVKLKWNRSCNYRLITVFGSLILSFLQLGAVLKVNRISSELSSDTSEFAMQYISGAMFTVSVSLCSLR